MERDGCWRWLVFILGLLVTVEQVKGEMAGVWTRVSPCVGEKCAHHQNPNTQTSSTTSTNNNTRVKKDKPSLTQALLLARSPSRVRRDKVRVELDEEKVPEGKYKSHRLGCTRWEERQAACLNGKCFALDMGHLRSPFCHCPAKYEGDRCEMLSPYYFSTYYARVKKGAIIGGVVVGIILIIVAISVYCSFRKGKRRRKERENKKPDSSETETKTPETAAMLQDGEHPV